MPAITKQEAELYIRMTLKQYGDCVKVIICPKRKTWLGKCNFQTETISVTEENLTCFHLFESTFLHELAHWRQYLELGRTLSMKNGRWQYHCPVWKKHCLSLGTKPTVTG
tara:strand:+ start:1027 stop:1356 length:330 start_codon:yes stop_codon:yes gene_type:complete